MSIANDLFTRLDCNDIVVVYESVPNKSTFVCNSFLANSRPTVSPMKHRFDNYVNSEKREETKLKFTAYSLKRVQ